MFEKLANDILIDLINNQNNEKMAAYLYEDIQIRTMQKMAALGLCDMEKTAKTYGAAALTYDLKPSAIRKRQQGAVPKFFSGMADKIRDVGKNIGDFMSVGPSIIKGTLKDPGRMNAAFTTTMVNNYKNLTDTNGLVAQNFLNTGNPLIDSFSTLSSGYDMINNLRSVYNNYRNLGGR